MKKDNGTMINLQSMTPAERDAAWGNILAAVPAAKKNKPRRQVVGFGELPPPPQGGRREAITLKSGPTYIECLVRLADEAPVVLRGEHGEWELAKVPSGCMLHLIQATHPGETSRTADCRLGGSGRYARMTIHKVQPPRGRPYFVYEVRDLSTGEDLWASMTPPPVLSCLPQADHATRQWVGVSLRAWSLVRWASYHCSPLGHTALEDGRAWHMHVTQFSRRVGWPIKGWEIGMVCQGLADLRKVGAMTASPAMAAIAAVEEPVDEPVEADYDPEEIPDPVWRQEDVEIAMEEDPTWAPPHMAEEEVETPLAAVFEGTPQPTEVATMATMEAMAEPVEEPVMGEEPAVEDPVEMADEEEAREDLIQDLMDSLAGEILAGALVAQDRSLLGLPGDRVGRELVENALAKGILHAGCPVGQYLQMATAGTAFASVVTEVV